MLDEFYYLACARRLDWGFVDHPALYPALLRLNVALAGDSIASIRLLPALAGGVGVFGVGCVAARLGGGRFAQVVSALAMIAFPLGLGVFTFASMNCLEPLFWTAALWLLAERCRSGDPRYWIWLGLLFGVALNSKHTIGLLIAVTVLVGALTPLRRDLLSRWPWLGAAIAAGLALPNLYWQWSHDWASLEFYRNITASGNAWTSPLLVAIDQLIISNPGLLPVWGAGLFMLLRGGGGRSSLRPVGQVCVVLLALALFGGQSRPDRVAGVYPLLFAAGAVQIEAARRRGLARGAAAASLGLGGAFIVVGALAGAPVLAPERVHAMLGEQDTDISEEVGRSRLPITLAHRTGWPEFMAEVDRVVASLAPDVRRDFVFLSDDYGHAGALELWGPERGYPAVYSPHNSGWLWGPADDVRPRAVVAIGIEEAFLRRSFARVEEVGRVRCAYCNLWLDDVPVWLAIEPARPLAESWPELKRYGNAGRKLRMLRAQQEAAPQRR
ncbi:MAG: glycosyltransferase family 39 protein [Deltaproteobacteria bacterium]|nr:glycosyltransferase family 39 protein [Deltaproteobacteria bacterium]MBW2414900.1 glycosyltransferase family 39 protein [Deltaproteobacteria bacterium]